MKLLLDVHALLWFFAGRAQPGAKALACIQDTRNLIFVSAATLREISIKDSPGKVENLQSKAREMGQRWLFGQRKSRGVFRLPRRRRGRKKESRVADQAKAASAWVLEFAGSVLVGWCESFVLICGWRDADLPK
jgi:hypothetical protein